MNFSKWNNTNLKNNYFINIFKTKIVKDYKQYLTTNMRYMDIPILSASRQKFIGYSH